MNEIIDIIFRYTQKKLTRDNLNFYLPTTRNEKTSKNIFNLEFPLEYKNYYISIGKEYEDIIYRHEAFLYIKDDEGILCGVFFLKMYTLLRFYTTTKYVLNNICKILSKILTTRIRYFDDDTIFVNGKKTTSQIDFFTFFGKCLKYYVIEEFEIELPKRDGSNICSITQEPKKPQKIPKGYDLFGNAL